MNKGEIVKNINMKYLIYLSIFLGIIFGFTIVANMTLPCGIVSLIGGCSSKEIRVVSILCSNKTLLITIKNLDLRTAIDTSEDIAVRIDNSNDTSGVILSGHIPPKSDGTVTVLCATCQTNTPHIISIIGPANIVKESIICK